MSKNESKTKILVCCHNESKTVSNNVYMPIHCGKALSEIELGIQPDNTGDNISHLNPHYSELTGMYWAWKNLNDIDYIGICHYRRLFDFNKKSRPFMAWDALDYDELDNYDYSIPNFEKIFKKKDIVLHKPYICQYDLRLMYCQGHLRDDFDKMERVIATQTPEYSNAFKRVMYNNNRASLHNLLIMRKEEYDKLCSWMFSILFQIEKETDYTSYSTFQKRMPAIMSERLVMIYVQKNKLRTKYYPYLWVIGRENKINFINNFLSRIKNTLLFPLINFHSSARE